MFYAGLDEIHQRKVREATPVERDVLVHVKGGSGEIISPMGLPIVIRCEPKLKETGKVNLSVFISSNEVAPGFPLCSPRPALKAADRDRRAAGSAAQGERAKTERHPGKLDDSQSGCGQGQEPLTISIDK